MPCGRKRTSAKPAFTAAESADVDALSMLRGPPALPGGCRPPAPRSGERGCLPSAAPICRASRPRPRPSRGRRAARRRALILGGTAPTRTPGSRGRGHPRSPGVPSCRPRRAQRPPCAGRSAPRHGANVASRCDQDERLCHFLGLDAESRSLVNRSHGVRVLQHVELEPRLLKEANHVRHRSPLFAPIIAVIHRVRLGTPQAPGAPQTRRRTALLSSKS